MADSATLLARLNKHGLSSATGCFEWQRATLNGYGRIKVQPGKVVAVHRLAWTLRYGEPSHMVLHRCDNKRCYRLDHLYDGDHDDNMRDAHERGRFRALRGEASPHAKLTTAQVLEIRSRYANEAGVSQRSLAREYGVTRGSIRSIVDRKTWKHI